MNKWPDFVVPNMSLSTLAQYFIYFTIINFEWYFSFFILDIFVHKIGSLGPLFRCWGSLTQSPVASGPLSVGREHLLMPMALSISQVPSVALALMSYTHLICIYSLEKHEQWYVHFAIFYGCTRLSGQTGFLSWWDRSEPIMLEFKLAMTSIYTGTVKSNFKQQPICTNIWKFTILPFFKKQNYFFTNSYDNTSNLLSWTVLVSKLYWQLDFIHIFYAGTSGSGYFHCNCLNWMLHERPLKNSINAIDKILCAMMIVVFHHYYLLHYVAWVPTAHLWSFMP